MQPLWTCADGLTADALTLYFSLPMNDNTAHGKAACTAAGFLREGGRHI